MQIDILFTDECKWIINFKARQDRVQAQYDLEK